MRAPGLSCFPVKKRLRRSGGAKCVGNQDAAWEEAELEALELEEAELPEEEEPELLLSASCWAAASSSMAVRRERSFS